MAELVSPCCGAEYSDDDNGPSYCCQAQISEEGLCYECHDHTEPDEGYVCGQCDDRFDEPEEDYEYDERMKESIAEDRMDEARDMGE